VLFRSGGELIQRAFPGLSKLEREFLQTGYTQEDWDKMFPKRRNPYRRNSDIDIQSLRRKVQEGDPEAALKLVTWLYRTGQISEERLELARSLGSEIAARILNLPKIATTWLRRGKNLSWSRWHEFFQSLIENESAGFNDAALTQISVAFVQHVIQLRKHMLGETLVRTFDKVLEAAMNWAHTPSQATARAVNDLIHSLPHNATEVLEELEEALDNAATQEEFHKLSVISDLTKAIIGVGHTATFSRHMALEAAADVAYFSVGAAAEARKVETELKWQQQYMINTLLMLPPSL